MNPFHRTPIKRWQLSDCGRPVQHCARKPFFKLSKYQDKMIKYIEDHPDFIQPVSRQKRDDKQLLQTGLRTCVYQNQF